MAEATPERIAESLFVSAQDVAALEGQARVAAAMVDGQGVGRVCRVILDKLAAAG
jgi:hypothetical protein